ncbi:epimerase [Cellulomonas sp. WB94]|uniref:NAD-dependent epimerase/dehydratase family protein n=1 Tax=Cellulomonas sp. WB94 TaxID=2173174 RepID=UPI000D56727C|nr:SDR family oxidoreductase [Cellulomonas sp. WB94]PVU82109.1 epimerase [Cellulomonas sp. WB94]
MTSSRPARVWVVGGGGLLGSAVTRALAGLDMFRSQPIPWREPHAASAVLSAEFERFSGGISGTDRWSIVWAAGAAVIATPASSLRDELSITEEFLTRLARRPPRGVGGFFLSSSAGVYAGSAHAPFDELSEPQPMNAYGRTKLGQEVLASSLLTEKVPFTIGRFSTLYGPGQRLDKPQGLISQMCVQAALNRPISIYVPMDTLRDYLYVDDAARLTREVVHRLLTGHAPQLQVMASERATTIAELVHIVRTVTRSRVGVTQKIITPGTGHARDLRLRSRWPLEAAQRPTPLPVGIRRTADAVLKAHRRGTLPALALGSAH